MSAKALAMTQEDLIKMFEKQLEPMLKAQVGSMVADIVKANMQAQIDEYRKANAVGFDGVFGKQPAAPKKRAAGDSAARIMRAIATCAFSKRPVDYASTLLKEWGDEDLAESVVQGQKNYDARMKAMGVSVATAGGTLVPEQFSQDIIEFLRPRSVVRKHTPTIQMPVGTMRIPKISQGSSAFYQAENANATASALQTGSVTLTFKKLVGLVPISNDLLRYASPNADAIVRNDMVRAIAQAENLAFLRGDGTAGSPRGLRFWAQTPNNLIGSAGTSLTNILTDLAAMIVNLKNANVPMTNCVWIMAPRSEMALMKIQNSNGFYVFRDEMLQGKLWGYPYETTTQVPTNLADHGGSTESEVYLTDFDECVLGESLNLTVDASSEAAYYDGANVQAAYSLDQTVVRAIEEHDFAVRRDQAIAVLNGVNWS